MERLDELRPFGTITAAHAFGLLSALGEYAVRAGHRAAHWADSVTPVWKVWKHPDAIRRHDMLSRFCCTRHASWGRLDEPDDDPDDLAVRLPDPARPVFAASFREILARAKYVRGLEQMTVDELCRLLGRLQRYATVARPMAHLDSFSSMDRRA